jgi:riboflavin kinase/FMN adenylyltransferase
MRVQHGSLGSIEAVEGPRAVSLGTFDGVHRGHQAILRELRQVASRSELTGSVVVTFGVHPRAVLEAGGAPPALTDLDERVSLIGATGIEEIVVLEFDEELAATEYDEFVDRLLVDRLKMAHFVLGHDVHFGRGRRGNSVTVGDLAEARGFNLSQVASVRDGDLAISSTGIRQALVDGDFDRAVRWSGHPFPLAGSVVRGRELGRELGFATANLEFPPGKVPLARGVYAGWARLDDGWSATVVNIGVAPTVSSDGPMRIEAHVLGRDVDLYGQRLELALSLRLREERKFSSKAELKAAIGADVEAAGKGLETAPDWSRPERLEALR